MNVTWTHWTSSSGVIMAGKALCVISVWRSPAVCTAAASSLGSVCATSTGEDCCATKVSLEDRMKGRLDILTQGFSLCLCWSVSLLQLLFNLILQTMWLESVVLRLSSLWLLILNSFIPFHILKHGQSHFCHSSLHNFTKQHRHKNHQIYLVLLEKKSNNSTWWETTENIWKKLFDSCTLYHHWQYKEWPTGFWRTILKFRVYFRVFSECHVGSPASTASWLI